MPTPIDYDDLTMAFEWVSAAAAPFENSAYVNRDSGKIHWAVDTDCLDEELPADLDDDSLYALVPHKHNLDLGMDLVFRFVRESLPDSYQSVQDIFGRRVSGKPTALLT